MTDPVGSSPSRNGIFNRFKQGLTRTTQALQTGLSDLFRGRKILDAAALESLEQVLIESDMGLELAMQLVEGLRTQAGTLDEARQYLFRVLREQFQLRERRLKCQIRSDSPQVLIFAGINGSGKTTSMAKISWRLQGEGRRVLLAAADTFRAAAIEQLDIWATRLDAPLVKHQMGADPAAVAHDAVVSARARNLDLVLVDTAGRLHNQEGLMEEMKKIVRVMHKLVGPDQVEILLVLDGNAGQNSFQQALTFQKSVPVEGIVITKLDGTAKGGIVIAVENELNIPVKYTGVGERAEDLLPFDPDSFVRALLDLDEESVT